MHGLKSDFHCSIRRTCTFSIRSAEARSSWVWHSDLTKIQLGPRMGKHRTDGECASKDPLSNWQPATANASPMPLWIWGRWVGVISHLCCPIGDWKLPEAIIWGRRPHWLQFGIVLEEGYRRDPLRDSPSISEASGKRKLHWPMMKSVRGYHGQAGLLECDSHIVWPELDLAPLNFGWCSEVMCCPEQRPSLWSSSPIGARNRPLSW